MVLLIPARNPHPRNRRRSHLPHPLAGRQNARRRPAAHTRRAEQTAYVGARQPDSKLHAKTDFLDRLPANVKLARVEPTPQHDIRVERLDSVLGAAAASAW